MTGNSFDSRGTLTVGDKQYEIYRLAAVQGAERLPFSLKILLENLLRTEDGANVTADHVRALAGWDPKAEPDTEIQFIPGPGHHAGPDRGARRGRPGRHARGAWPLLAATRRRSTRSSRSSWSSTTRSSPTSSAGPDAFARNVDLEFQRNPERFQFLRWGQYGVSTASRSSRPAPASCTRSTSSTWPGW